MSNRIEMSNYTFPLDREPKPVKVADFRNAIEHLERKVNADYHSCVTAQERAQWADSTRLVGSILIGMTCKRATLDDWNRRERAIDRSTALLEKAAK